MLHAFTLVYTQSKRIELRSFLRSAYMAKYQKDIPPDSLAEDLRLFQERQVLRQYLIEYVIPLIP